MHPKSWLFKFLAGNYKTQLYDKNTNDFMPSSPHIGMHVEVKDPDSKIILSKVYSSEGRFTFTSHTPGEHSICLYSNSTKWAMFGANNKMVNIQVLMWLYCVTYCYNLPIDSNAKCTDIGHFQKFGTPFWFWKKNLVWSLTRFHYLLSSV